MNYKKIFTCILKVFSDCNVNSFPLDCNSILKYYGYTIYTYSELQTCNPELHLMCTQYSDDAFRDGNSMVIAYNDRKPVGRTHFSLMHELGHHMLKHLYDNPYNEKEANAFASNILAPRMAIHYSKCNNMSDVQKYFLLSPEASQYAYNDYKNWRRLTAYKLSALDKIMYSHFYNKDEKRFVWKISHCDFCGKTLYNTDMPRCRHCAVPNEYHAPKAAPALIRDDNYIALQQLERRWLYGELN